MPNLHYKYGDDTKLQVGPLPRVPAKRISELTNTLVRMVANWPIDRLTHCLGISLQLHL